ELIGQTTRQIFCGMRGKIDLALEKRFFDFLRKKSLVSSNIDEANIFCARFPIAACLQRHDVEIEIGVGYQKFSPDLFGLNKGKRAAAGAQTKSFFHRSYSKRATRCHEPASLVGTALTDFLPQNQCISFVIPE